MKSPTSEIPGTLPSSETSRFIVDGLQPQVAVEPKSVEEIGELLRLAGTQKWGIVPFGAGTKQRIGNPLRRFDVAISLANFNRVPEYEPEDLVVKVESGCRLVDLQRTLAPDNLFLPLDPVAKFRQGPHPAYSADCTQQDELLKTVKNCCLLAMFNDKLSIRRWLNKTDCLQRLSPRLRRGPRTRASCRRSLLLLPHAELAITAIMI